MPGNQINESCESFASLTEKTGSSTNVFLNDHYVFFLSSKNQKVATHIFWYLINFCASTLMSSNGLILVSQFDAFLKFYCFALKMQAWHDDSSSLFIQLEIKDFNFATCSLQGVFLSSPISLLTLLTLSSLRQLIKSIIYFHYAFYLVEMINFVILFFIRIWNCICFQKYESDRQFYSITRSHNNDQWWYHSKIRFEFVTLEGIFLIISIRAFFCFSNELKVSETFRPISRSCQRTLKHIIN